MKTFYSLLSIGILSLLAVAGCSKDSDTVSPIKSDGTLKMLLTDAPGSFDEVRVTFSQIAVHKSADSDSVSSADSLTSDDSGWIIVTDQEETFDLLSLSNGATALLGNKKMEAGHYTQIRIAIKSVTAVIDSEEYDVTVPSDNLKLVSGFDIAGNATTELVVDFDVARSIHKTGGKNAKYMLKPTIRIIKNTGCGSITGTVVNFTDAPVAYVMAGADTVSSTVVNRDNGSFTLGFLSAGTYAVSVTDTLNKSYTNPSVTVSAGAKTDLGSITLE